MAKVMQNKRTRGRKPGALKTGVVALLDGIGPAGDDTAYSVEVTPAIGRAKSEMLDFTAPKGAVIVPLSLTDGKSDGNARQTIQNAAKTAGVSITVGSVAFEFEKGPRKGEQTTLFYASLRA